MRNLLILILLISSFSLHAQTVVEFRKDARSNKEKNYSSKLNSFLRDIPKKDVKIIFQKGTYHFKPEGSTVMEHAITNHDDGIKNIAFFLEEFENIEIDGNGSEFIFSGRMLPLLLKHTHNIILKNFSIDWEHPFFVQGEVISTNIEAGTYDLKLLSKNCDYDIIENRLRFHVKQANPFSTVGESLVFNKKSKSPIYASSTYFDIHRKDEDVLVEQLTKDKIKVHEALKVYPPVGSIITYKGPMGENRYAPAIHSFHSSNITVTNVNIYHALGMGFLAERTDNVVLDKMNVMLRKGTKRYLSATADATHFCNCKGSIKMENCLFENMLDDGTNIHGTYLIVDEIINNTTVRASFGHFQQKNYIFAESGDDVWFLITPSPQRGYENRVRSIHALNDNEVELTFLHDIPSSLKTGDLIENKTWNAESVVIRNCKMHNHRARNIVLKTPGNTLIENNFFSSMMASILLRAEAFFWFESGANENITIRNNYFVDCVYGGGKQAVIHIQPRMKKSFDTKFHVDKNILIENNVFQAFDNQIINAKSIDGLSILNNKIIATKTFTPFAPDSPLITISNCKDVILQGNEYRGNSDNFVETDRITDLTITTNENKGVIKIEK